MQYLLHATYSSHGSRVTFSVAGKLVTFHMSLTLSLYFKSFNAGVKKLQTELEMTYFSQQTAL